jgi:mono/diheme cytochrome c family protein
MKAFICLTSVVLLASSVSLAADSKMATMKAGDAKLGKVIFSNNCQGCHGDKAQGGVGPKLAGEVGSWKFDIFKRALMKGIDDHGKALKAPMPNFSQVGFGGKKPTDKQLMDLHAYLKTFK